ncbi:MAG: glycosyltransferase family 2 protein, partial [Gammaproteobacteria bacterium]|nr:glycosyltransferase family 2 protein [Gammaproteobacteria bacterium]
ENGHISAASNSALQLATGDYIGLLDHDDELAPDALLSIASAINKNPDVKLIYSDEDKIDRVGRRREPHFKSDWNPDLLLSHNYIGHLCVFEHDRVKECGAFREGFEGSQDHDLLLRFTHDLDCNAILHIPQVLYHWRAVAGSTALNETAKEYTNINGIKAVHTAARRINDSASVDVGLMPNSYRVTFPIPDAPPLVSLLIPTRDQLSLTRQCITSIVDLTRYHNFEIIIVDNGSVHPETLAYFDEIASDSIRVLRYNAPFNFSAINNYAVRHARGSILGFVNNDIEVISEDWLTEMVSHAAREGVGCVGAKLYYSDGSIQHAGVILGLGGVAGHSHKHFPRDHPGHFGRLRLVQNLSAVTAACMLVRRSIFEEVGGFNETDLTIAFNDVDFCLRVRALGYRNVWTPYAELYHHESASRGHEDTPEKSKRFAAEIQFMKDSWKEELIHDPYYSPNLTRDREDFSIAT